MPANDYLRRPQFNRTGVAFISGSGSPKSGTSGTGVKVAGKGSMYSDVSNGSLWTNEGTSGAPYWSPVGGINGAGGGLWGVETDFRDGVGTALAATDGSVTVAGSGLRIFGQGIAETDSGAVANAAGEGGTTMRLTTTDEVAHTVAIGTAAGVYQPDQHGMGLIDVEVSNATAITLRGMGVGFVGLAADAFDPPITTATTVTTLVLDDLFLLHFNVGYTDVDRYFVGHNKSDAAATQSTAAGGRDTGVDVAAAGTYQRLRVEIDADGAGRIFIDKSLVFSAAAMVDVDEELSPVLYLESTSTAVKSLDVRRFMFVANRP